MKNLIFISGTMGVGKTTTCRELQQILPDNVFLDGDWCWDMNPFVVNNETKLMVIENIAFLLSQFINCSVYQNIIFCWVMHEQSIINQILSKIKPQNYILKQFCLVADEETLIDRLKIDISKGIRTPDIIDRSIDRMNDIEKLDISKINVSNISAKEAAQIIKMHIYY